MTSCQARPFTAVLKQCLAPTCTGSQIRSFSQSDTACGDPCSDIFALVAFELAPLKGVMWMQSDGEEDVGEGAGFFFFFRSAHFFVSSHHIGEGLEGSRGLFPLRISFVLGLRHVLPASYGPTSKVWVETKQHSTFGPPSFHVPVLASFKTQTLTPIFCTCSNF